MKIAVLMSTYNGETYLREQIKSILNQTGEFDLELWVRDDGSSDHTIEILSEYEQMGLLRWFDGENLGPGKSFLKLLKDCQNFDYYAFADQDDWWKPDKINRAIKKLVCVDGVALYCSNALVVDKNLKDMGRKVYRSLPSLDFKSLTCAGGLMGCTMVFNNEMAKLIQKNNLPECLIMHDFYLAELCLAYNGYLIFDNESTMKYRQHGNNVVGVSSGFWTKLRNRIHEITTQNDIGIAEQAKQILDLYQDLPNDNQQWLEHISKYKRNFWHRLSLSIDPNTKYINLNMAIKNRLAILFGNR